MAALREFEFGGFKLKPATADYYRLAEVWTKNDPDHRDKLDFEFWLEQDACRDSYLLFDQDGPLFFFKMHLINRQTVRVFIQFPTEATSKEFANTPEDIRKAQRTGERLRRGLLLGMAWLEEMLKKNGVKEIFFDSVSKSLISFCVKRLGFTEEGEYLKKHLAA